MKRLIITLFVILIILFVLNFIAAILVSNAVEKTLRSVSGQSEADIAFTSVSARPWAASVTIHDLIYTGSDHPFRMNAGSLDVKLRHSDILKLIFTGSGENPDYIHYYRFHAAPFSFSHEGYNFEINASEAEWAHQGSLGDVFTSAETGRLPDQEHIFLLNLKEAALRSEHVTSLPGFSVRDGFMVTDIIRMHLEFTPDNERLNIREAVIEDQQNRAEYRGNALFFPSDRESALYRIEAEIHLETASPDFKIAVPGNSGMLQAQSMNATLLTTLYYSGQQLISDDYVLRFTAGNAAIIPSSAVEQQLQPMFRMLGIPFQPLSVKNLNGDAIRLNNRFEFTIHEAETPFTKVRFQLSTMLQEEDVTASPVTGGTLELFDMQPQVVQLVRGLASFMNWQLRWDGNSVYVPVTGTLEQPQLQGITTR
jgi:hypothetical protein